jgi:hypothetical protein
MNLINYWWIQLVITEFTCQKQSVPVYEGVAHFHRGKFFFNFTENLMKHKVNLNAY